MSFPDTSIPTGPKRILGTIFKGTIRVKPVQARCQERIFGRTQLIWMLPETVSNVPTTNRAEGLNPRKDPIPATADLLG